MIKQFFLTPLSPLLAINRQCRAFMGSMVLGDYIASLVMFKEQNLTKSGLRLRVTTLGWWRTLTALLFRSQSVSVQAPYKENVPVSSIN